MHYLGVVGQDTQPQATGTQASAFSGLSEKQEAEKLLGICVPIAKKNGLLPSVATAQCILESGYCRTELAQKANNICGMKCSLSGNTWGGMSWDGKSSVQIRTAEQDTAGDILPDTTEAWYRVRKSWKDTKSQIGAFHSLAKAKQCADQHAGCHVFDENGKKLYTSAKVPYKIRVTKTNVPIRTGPAKKYSKARTYCPIGVYEITEEKNGFGRLKSGAGWVHLKKVERL